MNLLLRAYDNKNDYIAYQGQPDIETLSSFIYHFGNCEISNYIGILDKNGNEIFSNDIIRLTSYFGFNSDICEVYYDEKMCRYSLKDLSNRNCGIPLNARNSKYYEIIGNKYRDTFDFFLITH